MPTWWARFSIQRRDHVSVAQSKLSTTADSSSFSRFVSTITRNVSPWRAARWTRSTMARATAFTVCPVEMKFWCSACVVGGRLDEAHDEIVLRAPAVQ